MREGGHGEKEETGVVVVLEEARVADLDDVVAAQPLEHQIARRQIAVHDPVLVQVVHARGHVLGEIDERVERQLLLPALEVVPQRAIGNAPAVNVHECSVRVLVHVAHWKGAHVLVDQVEVVGVLGHAHEGHHVRMTRHQTVDRKGCVSCVSSTNHHRTHRCPERT